VSHPDEEQAPNSPVPANVERILDLLADGPMPPGDISEQLKKQKRILSEGLIRRLPGRFGHLLFLDADGNLALIEGIQSEAEPEVPTKQVREAISWSEVAFAAPAYSGDGLEILNGDGPWIPGECETPVKAVVAFAPGVMSLSQLVTRSGSNQTYPDLPVADLAFLSVLLQPSGEARELPDLLTVYGLNPQDRSASSIAELARRMVADTRTGLNWPMAIDRLAVGGDPWGFILVPPNHQHADQLDVAADPLLTFDTARSTSSATLGLETAFDGLSKRDDLVLRPQQTQMARAVAEHFDTGSHLAVEAPTGTGKTLAYLLPALAQAAHAARPVIIATKTKMLQRQVRAEVERLAAMGLVHAPFREIYGVRNYVCARELMDAAEGGATLPRPVAQAAAVAARALGVPGTGTWEDVTDRHLCQESTDYRVARERMKTDAAGCDGRECEAAAVCPLLARKSGAHPGIIATNHALVGAWTGSDEADGIAMFDGPDQVSLVFDEAHDLEDSLATAWTKELSLTQMRRLSADLKGMSGRTRRAQRLLAAAGLRSTWSSDMRQAGRDLDAATTQLSDAVSAYAHEYSAKGRPVELRTGIATRRAEYVRIRAAAGNATRALRPVQALLREAVGIWRTGRQHQKTGEQRSLARAGRSLNSLSEHCREFESGLHGLERLEDGHRLIHLVESARNESGESDWVYRRVPIEIGDMFRSRILAKSHATVLTSATLAVAGSFDFLADRLGLQLAPDGIPEAERPINAVSTLQLSTPFNFAEQSMLVLTSHLPVPVPINEAEFCEEVAADTAGLLSLTGGRALGLFAARSRLDKVADYLEGQRDALLERGVSVLVQGRESPLEIRRRFNSDEGSALLGVRTYWEGFDAPGRTLSYLQIEKAPYPSPDDPVHAARARALSARGGDPFLEYTVPRTAIQFAQGFGRLIRSPQDRGAAFILDRRMQFPSLANEILLNSLPGVQIHYARDREDAWSTAIRFVDGVDPDLTQALHVATADTEALVHQLRLVMDEPLEPQLRKAAQDLFGIEALSPEQVELMIAVLTGRDAVGILPTGAGKSLTFQLPAILRPDDRATLVVSPLVALIKDQVDTLRVRHHLRMVSGITGRTSASERTEILRDLADGRLRLLYVSPERLVADVALREALSQSDLGMVVVDEAHCISSWGHDFRPEFRQIARSLMDFRRSPRLALTATATPDVQQDISTVLNLQDPLVVRRPIARSDLRYRVMDVNRDVDRLQEILRIIEKDPKATGLIYVSRRALADEVAWNLRQAGVAARPYHAGMEPQQRESAQDDFLDGTTRVIVATKAFGMGINKPDIAWVLHFDPPDSLESYAQEAGRAARSPSMTGDCLLMVKKGDLTRRLKMVDSEGVDETMTQVRAVWGILRGEGPDILLDPEEAQTQAGVEADRLSVILGWLERTGHVDRLPNCAVAGMVGHGFGQPEDEDERKLFLRVKLEQLSLRVGARRRVPDLAELAARVGLRREEMEQRLVGWTLQRYITFQPTQTRWRLTRRRDNLSESDIVGLIARWRSLEKRRLWDLDRYIRNHDICRRVSMALVFGDDPVCCADLPSVEECDVCSVAAPLWHTVRVEDIPDPEQLIDINAIVLQAVRWSTGNEARNYGRAGLKRALMGQDTYAGGLPLGKGLMACPHFGALAYLRSADRRFDDAVVNLRNKGYLDLRNVKTVGSEYESLRLTPSGVAFLSGVENT
jgi:ATP-dependent DNA helicase RecQ